MEKLYILASASPRRKEILANIGIDFQVITSECEEVITKSIPSEIVKELAYIKCMDVAGRISKGEVLSVNYDTEIYVIGADTMVVSDNKPIGKPSDKEDAVRMIKNMMGRSHQVMTGVCISKIIFENGIWRKDKWSCFHEETQVNVLSLTDSEIEEYVNTNDPLDKAGAYGIQGLFSRYISGINGDYFNVVGLPASRLYQELKFF